MPLASGTTLGPYTIESPLGAGGMGEVYKARDTRLDRTVAIKVLPEHVASDPDLKQRFEREAKTISSLNHPHICTLHDIGNQDGIDFLVMEYLDGETLKRFSDSPCTAWARRGTSACTNAGGPMQAYSMDLRERALLDSDAGMQAADVAVKYRVSGSWVRLLKQRRRETGEVAPRVQRHGRRRMLEPHLHTLAALIAEQPDRTLAELKDALGTPASLATIWRAVAALDVTVKKNGPALRTRST